MELAIWAIFMFAAAVFCFFMGKHPDMLQELAKHWLTKLPKAVEKEINDFTDWKAYAAQGRKLKKEAHEQWLEEAYAILQPACKHIYYQSDSEKWFICVECQYSEPWEYRAGCDCQCQEVKNISDPTPWYTVTERKSWCKWHGRDFNSYPYSDRTTVGPYYGTSNKKHYERKWDTATGGYTADPAYENSKAVSKGRKLRPIFEIKGTN